ncbi:MAG: pentapeptide repeat-containing protein, partial [Phormidesmis sp.]
TGIDSWNQWRSHHPNEAIDLSHQDLSHGYFFEGNLQNVNLKGANLQRACLIGANLAGVDLTGADLTGAYLGDANLTGANLSQADLTDANLDRTDLRTANLLGTKITGADIRTAQLPDPNADPYVDEVVSFLAKQRLAPPTKDRTQQQSSKTAPHRPTYYRQSLLRQMIARIPPLTNGLSKQSVAMRQQAIRQSAALITKPAKPPSSQTVSQTIPQTLSVSKTLPTHHANHAEKAEPVPFPNLILNDA